MTQIIVVNYGNLADNINALISECWDQSIEVIGLVATKADFTNSP